VFRCEKCGSSYSAMHAVAMENCPRCLVREQIAVPLTFKVFEATGSALPGGVPGGAPPAASGDGA